MKLDDDIIMSAKFLADPANASRPDRDIFESQLILKLRRVANSTPPPTAATSPAPTSAVSQGDAEAALAAELLAAYFAEEEA